MPGGCVCAKMLMRVNVGLSGRVGMGVGVGVGVEVGVGVGMGVRWEVVVWLVVAAAVEGGLRDGAWDRVVEGAGEL